MDDVLMAFTIKAAGRLREIVSDIGVSAPYIATSVEEKNVKIHNTSALWDTGATNSVITKSTASTLGLLPISKAIVYHAGGQSEANVYLMNIYLPNDILVPSMLVAECDDNEGFGIIIGMDIISHGDFSITNVGGNTVFSFRIPSIETIDYEKKT